MEQTKAQAAYARWCAAALDAEMQQELLNLAGQDAEIEECFGRDLVFGTGGLRGVLGPGSNRMNIYTVRKATQGLARYLQSTQLPQRVAIAYDSRIHSDLFAAEAAKVLCANGIEVWLYPRLEPTPTLSWAVRYYQCGAGICITASHNPAKYNGYKVYGPDGCQITLAMADAIYAQIAAVDCFDDVQTADIDLSQSAGLYHRIDEQCLADYLDAVLALRVGDGTGIEKLRLVYTPLCGSGLECVTALTRRLGISSFHVVPEQEQPDGHFPTCPYPNPEIREAMETGIALCRTLHPDIFIGTDPDCDRCGTAVPDGQGDYRLITGNEMGVILLDYICQQRLAQGTMPDRPVAVTTIVSTALASQVAAHYGVELRRTLTGFKFIGEQIGKLEAAGEAERYIFGFEESYGYLSGTHVRDKDAVNATLLICEAAAWYAQKGMTLGDAIDALYKIYGYRCDGLCSFTFEGLQGLATMQQLMQKTRETPPAQFAGLDVVSCVDYIHGVGDLPKADVLEYGLSDGSKLLIRPSGTEPKIKVYLSAVAESKDAAEAKLALLKTAAEALCRVS